MKRNFKALTELFRPRFLRRLAFDDYTSLLSETLSSYGSIKEFSNLKRLSSLFKKAYKHLSINCQYEYVYKTAILNEIFFRYHDFNSAFYTTEFFCGNSKSDIAIFNGYSSAYEIKTKFDNLEKLEKQILDYKKVFNKVSVVVDERHLKNVEKIVDKCVGIFFFQENGTISEVRKAIVDVSCIDISALFDCLHKPEYKEIIHARIGKVLHIPNALEYTKYRQLFMDFSQDIALQSVIDIIRSRKLQSSRLALIQKAPTCLCQAILDSNLTMAMSNSIIEKMEKPFAMT